MDDELLIFIRGSLRSVWALELLLLLRRDRRRSWGVGELVQEMRASTPVVNESLQALQTAGLTSGTADGRFSYAPASLALDEICGRLEAAYKQKPVSVVNAIVSAPKNNLQTFADAFRIKGKGDPQ